MLGGRRAGPEEDDSATVRLFQEKQKFVHEGGRKARSGLKKKNPRCRRLIRREEHRLCAAKTMSAMLSSARCGRLRVPLPQQLIASGRSTPDGFPRIKNFCFRRSCAFGIASMRLLSLIVHSQPGGGGRIGRSTDRLGFPGAGDMGFQARGRPRQTAACALSLRRLPHTLVPLVNPVREPSCRLVQEIQAGH